MIGQAPTETCPYIKGLLDPCTNSKVAPNIPAEVLYDKLDNGLIKLNSWSGYYVILNPDFKAQVGTKSQGIGHRSSGV